jgi:serine/threonine protein kinase
MPNFISASAINLIQNLLVLNPGSRLSIKAIKSHEWFRQISMSPAYGLNNNEYIAYSRELINNL